jgi:hypothetical protein
MLEKHLDEVYEAIDDLRNIHGEILDFDHIDSTTRTVFISRLDQCDPALFLPLKRLLKELNPEYRVGSILRLHL